MKKFSLRWKVLLMVIGIIVILGVLITFYIRSVVYRSFLEEVKLRGKLIATELAFTAVDPVINEDEPALMELVERAKRVGDAEYALIIDAKGHLLAHTFEEDPPETFVKANVITSERETLVIKQIKIGGRAYVDIAKPILGAELGTARVGIPMSIIENRLSRIIMSMNVIVLFVLLAGILIAILFSNSIVNPIVHLTEVANKISMGDFDVKIEVKSKDEIGELAKAIERMSKSLQLAIERLKR
ncbi:MAG: hypothetical protein DRQ10_02480 [Candidatus Hydrothermota bacterium]|nr:MAG: hypothetical protein DRQ10_02480 [Candidatus Hydrothermae bacterium]